MNTNRSASATIRQQKDIALATFYNNTIQNKTVGTPVLKPGRSADTTLNVVNEVAAGEVAKCAPK